MRVLLTLRHEDLLPFIGRYYFRDISWVAISHYFLSVLFFALWVRTGIDLDPGGNQLLGGIGWAIVAFVVCIPVHEAIHGFIYWLFGARDIRFQVSLRNAYAYVIAHRHVVGARQFVWIGIAPFLGVTALTALMLALFPSLVFVLAGFLALHTVGCAGDWAMLNYIWFNRSIELYTYDDADEGLTYFVCPPGEQGTSAQ